MSVPSPCTSLCCFDDRIGYCVGCLRTIEEITGWSKYTDDERLAVLAQVEKRRAEHPAYGELPRRVAVRRNPGQGRPR